MASVQARAASRKVLAQVLAGFGQVWCSRADQEGVRFRYGLLACLLTLAGIPAGAAVGAAVGSSAGVTSPGTPVAHAKHCRVRPDSAQRAPASAHRAQYAAAHSGGGQTLAVVVPRTTCNAGR